MAPQTATAQDGQLDGDASPAFHQPYEEMSLQIMWKELGRTSRDAGTGCLNILDAPAGPGVYRLRLSLGAGREAWHIEEADDVQASLLAIEKSKATVRAEVTGVEILEGAVLGIDGQAPRAADLNRPEERMLLKMATCIALGAQWVMDVFPDPAHEVLKHSATPSIANETAAAPAAHGVV